MSAIGKNVISFNKTKPLRIRPIKFNLLFTFHVLKLYKWVHSYAESKVISSSGIVGMLQNTFWLSAEYMQYFLDGNSQNPRAKRNENKTTGVQTKNYCYLLVLNK